MVECVLSSGFPAEEGVGCALELDVTVGIWSGVHNVTLQSHEHGCVYLVTYDPKGQLVKRPKVVMETTVNPRLVNSYANSPKTARMKPYVKAANTGLVLTSRAPVSKPPVRE